MVKPRKPSKRITTKAVQAAESDQPPVTLPDVPAKPEQDDDPWDREGLTLKQRRFCEAYIGEAAGNATRAAQIAGYRDDNYFSLAGTAADNLKKPQVRGFIGRLLAAQQCTPEYLRNRLAELSKSSLNDCITIGDDGKLELDMEQAARLGALGQIKEVREDVIKGGEETSLVRRTVKLHDPTRAIELLLKMQGALVERHEVTGPAGGPVEHTVTHAFDADKFADLYRRRTNRDYAGAGPDPANDN